MMLIRSIFKALLIWLTALIMFLFYALDMTSQCVERDTERATQTAENRLYLDLSQNARVVELVDTLVSGASAKSMLVRVQSRAPFLGF